MEASPTTALVECTAAAVWTYKTDESEKWSQESKQKGGKQDQDRSALVDITNDSPIVGLASGASMKAASPAPSSLAEGLKKGFIVSKNWTPGSGESILRDQVKTLLKKVEGDGKMERHLGPMRLLGVSGSHASLIAPTPANTPSVDILHPSPEEGADPTRTQEGEEEEEEEEERRVISRSLLLDFTMKSESCGSPGCPSAISCQEEKHSSLSPWSLQENASDEEEEVEEEEVEEEEEDEEGGGEEDGIGELCEGMERVSMREKGRKFEGRHTRFVYDSEGEEMTGEEVVKGGMLEGSLVLKGVPMATGTHLRFQEDGDEVETK